MWYSQYVFPIDHDCTVVIGNRIYVYSVFFSLLFFFSLEENVYATTSEYISARVICSIVLYTLFVCGCKYLSSISKFPNVSYPVENISIGGGGICHAGALEIVWSSFHSRSLHPHDIFCYTSHVHNLCRAKCLYSLIS